MASPQLDSFLREVIIKLKQMGTLEGEPEIEVRTHVGKREKLLSILEAIPNLGGEQPITFHQRRDIIYPNAAGEAIQCRTDFSGQTKVASNFMIKRQKHAVTEDGEVKRRFAFAIEVPLKAESSIPANRQAVFFKTRCILPLKH